MKGFKNKKGISLIVLVITIIVMIILAAAIILSLNNSGIIGKANKAKQDSDAASLKEYVNVLEAEWELKTAEAQNYSSKEEYVNTKLEKEGYKGALLTEDGILYSNLQANAKAALKANIQIGDTVVGYNAGLTSKTIETSGKENTSYWNDETVEYEEVESQPQSVSNAINLTWKFMGISDNGEVLIVPDSTFGLVRVSGEVGYRNGPSEINRVCEELYSTEKGTARSITLEDVNKVLETSNSYSSGNWKDNITQNTVRKDLICSGSYWLASSSNGKQLHFDSSFGTRMGSDPFETKPLRPVVALNSNVTITKDTSKNNTWNI